MEGETTNILIIPGGGVTAVDRIAGTSTGRRCRKAAEIVRQTPEKVDLIFTLGGLPHPPYIQTVPTAILAKEYLIKHGVPHEIIVAIPEGRDSFEEIRAAIRVCNERIITQPNMQVVTFAQHAVRYAITFGHYGYKLGHIDTGDPISTKHKAIENILIRLTRRDPEGKRWYWRYNRWRRTYPERPPFATWMLDKNF